jgi:cytochrome c oxidase cbb3-type subunit 4
MDTYSLLREIADSWVLLAMFAYFIGAGVWAFLPSQSKARKDASMIPLRDDVAVKSPKGQVDGWSQS